MPLGLPKLASTVKGIEAIVVSSTRDDILFDAWSRQETVLTNQDAAGYLGLFVRTRKEVLDGLGFERSPLSASIETDDSILLFHHIRDDYLLVFVFHTRIPFGLARLQGKELKAAIAKALGEADPDLENPDLKAPETLAAPTTQSNDSTTPFPQTTPSDHVADTPPIAAFEREEARPTHTTPTIAADEDAHVPLPDVDPVDNVIPTTMNDAVLFDPEVVDDAPQPVIDDDVVFAIGNLEPDPKDANAGASAGPSTAETPSDTSSPPKDEGTPMSTHPTIVHQQETAVVSTAMQQKEQSLEAMQGIAQRSLKNARLRMTFEGGRPDETPVDTPTEAAQYQPPTVAAHRRMANEGGPVPEQPVDTPTVPRQNTVRIQHNRMANEGGPVLQKPVDTPTEPRPNNVQKQHKRMANEGGPVPQQPVDTPTEQDAGVSDTSPSSATAGVPPSVSRATETLQRAQDVIAYVTANVENPSTAQARLALHSRVPLERILTPKRLDAMQTLQIEEAAKAMLGVNELPL